MGDIYDIASSGMAAQRVQMDLIGENLANAGVVRADGSVFQPRTAVLQPGVSFGSVLEDAVLQPGADEHMQPAGDSASSYPEDETNAFFSFGDSSDRTGVSVARVVGQHAAPVYRLDPGNPWSQHNGPHKGYVALPDVDPIHEMVELIATGRAYDANVGMLQAAKQMDLEAADIDRT